VSQALASKKHVALTVSLSGIMSSLQGLLLCLRFLPRPMTSNVLHALTAVLYLINSWELL
jgi:hypothetical protein